MQSINTTIKAASLTALFSVAAMGSELSQQARDILKNTQVSIITVTALSKLDMSGSGLPVRLGGLGEAQESSCSGVVVDATGLTAVSYSALNPMEKMSSMLKIKIGDDGDNEVKGKTELSRIQMRMADGTEVPARVVFKDKELDLAFVVPELKEGGKALTFSPVNLRGGITAKELDDVVMLTRHEKDLGCQPILSLAHVTSGITKPRQMYGLSHGGRPGTAVFLPSGQVLGVLVAMGGGDSKGMMAIGKMEMLVLPADDLIKLATQAKEAANKKSEKAK